MQSESYLTTSGEAFGFVRIIPILLGLLPVTVTWFLLARSRFLSGDPEMTPTPNRLPQLYGYTVCLVAIVVALVSVSSIIGHMFRLREPLQATERWGSASLTSFEAYKATYQADAREPFIADAGAKPPARDSLSDDQLRRRYEALRADRIASARFDAQRGLVTHGLMLLFAGVLFAVHWGWLKRQG